METGDIRTGRKRFCLLLPGRPPGRIFRWSSFWNLTGSGTRFGTTRPFTFFCVGTACTDRHFQSTDLERTANFFVKVSISAQGVQREQSMVRVELGAAGCRANDFRRRRLCVFRRHGSERCHFSRTWGGTRRHCVAMWHLGFWAFGQRGRRHLSPFARRIDEAAIWVYETWPLSASWCGLLFTETWIYRAGGVRDGFSSRIHSGGITGKDLHRSPTAPWGSETMLDTFPSTSMLTLPSMLCSPSPPQMAQRVTLRKRQPYNTTSNRRRVVKTPGGKLVVHHLKKLPSQPKCGDCGEGLAGIPALRPREYANISKRQKTVQRAYGGSRCAGCVKNR